MSDSEDKTPTGEVPAEAEEIATSGNDGSAVDNDDDSAAEGEGEGEGEGEPNQSEQPEDQNDGSPPIPAPEENNIAQVEEEEEDEEEDEEDDEVHPWEDEQCKVLFRVYCTVRSMLKKRGYGLIQTGALEDIKVLEVFEDPTKDVQAFYNRMRGNTGDVERSKMRIEATRGSELELEEQGEDAVVEKAVVYFEEKGKMSVDAIGKIEQDAKNVPNISRIILVSAERTAATVRQLDLINNDPNRVAYMEHFRERELLMDITAHKLVPQHKVLTPAEKEDLLARYKIDTYQLPKIRIQDPVARYFGLLPGQVVKISRPSETAGRYVTYRVCVLNSID